HLPHTFPLVTHIFRGITMHIKILFSLLVFTLPTLILSAPSHASKNKTLHTHTTQAKNDEQKEKAAGQNIAITKEYVLKYMRFCASSQFYGQRLWNDSKIIAGEGVYYEAQTESSGDKKLTFFIDIYLAELNEEAMSLSLQDPIKERIVQKIKENNPEDGATFMLDAQTECTVDACYLDKIRLHCTTAITRKQFLSFMEELRKQQ
ncbi:hypothetical protein, partial [Methylicorpusculum sp.]|uniref:hypothetical protein n=1 Tax=Methylicorpusculum sp. TaxID=2713644 RepID=UPI002AB9658B